MKSHPDKSLRGSGVQAEACAAGIGLVNVISMHRVTSKAFPMNPFDVWNFKMFPSFMQITSDSS